MNIVTIMNYDFKKYEEVVMCLMWIHSVRKASPVGSNIFVLSEKSLPKPITEYFRHFNIVNEICKPYRDESLHHNYRFKFYNLSHLDFPYIFMDADMFVMGNLEYLWERRNDKPWIGINHQLNIPGHTGNYHFLNSGIQIVSDPKFCNFDEIISFGKYREFYFDVPGKDQALLYTWFSSSKYDYTHKDIGPEWNACARYTKLENDDLMYWHGTCTGLGDEYPVYINHYWHLYKPWMIDCPAYKWYKQNCPISEKEIK